MDLTTPHPIHKSLLSSITSTELRRIVFPVTYSGDVGLFAQVMEEWVFIDKLLCELVDRLRVSGYHHILEVEVRPKKIGIDPEEYDFTEVFPGFREKGTVTIIADADYFIIPGDHLSKHSNAFYR